jgi:hypothetical protein
MMTQNDRDEREPKRAGPKKQKSMRADVVSSSDASSDEIERDVDVAEKHEGGKKMKMSMIQRRATSRLDKIKMKKAEAVVVSHEDDVELGDSSGDDKQDAKKKSKRKSVSKTKKRSSVSMKAKAKAKRSSVSSTASASVAKIEKTASGDSDSDEKIASPPPPKAKSDDVKVKVKDGKKSMIAKMNKSHSNILNLAESPDTEIDDDITSDFEKLKRKNEERKKSASAHSGKEIS